MTGPTRISRLGIVNTYLVPEDDGLTVIDTMLPRSAGKILDAAREMGAPITRILLTHAHGAGISAARLESAAVADVLVIFGITGDLAGR